MDILKRKVQPYVRNPNTLTPFSVNMYSYVTLSSQPTAHKHFEKVKCKGLILPFLTRKKRKLNIVEKL